MPCAREHDRRYILSTSGMLKLFCFFFTLMGLFCVLISSVALHNLRGAFYIATAVLGLVCTTLVFVVRFYQLCRPKIYSLNALKCEMYLHGSLGVVFFFAAAFVLTLNVVLYSVAAFFGFLVACLYGYDFYLGYQISRKIDAATQTA